MIGQVRRAAIAMLLVLASVSPVFAVDLFDNLGSGSSGTNVSFKEGFTVWNAQQFLTDAKTYSLVDVTLSMLRSSGTGNATVDIYSESNGRPSVSIATLTSPGSYSSNLSNTVFTASGVTLAPNSAYWVVLKGPGANTVFEWSFSGDDSGSGVGYSHVWADSDDLGASWARNVGGPFQMRVNANVVPEPSSLILGGLALAISEFARRRRDRTRSRGN